MRIEDLVPPMKLCKQIPKGKFADSALVWRGTNHLWWDYYTMPRECGNCRELDPGEIIAPAPTLAEIIEELPKYVEYRWYNGKFCPCHPKYDPEDFSDKNPATAALKLWLEVNKPDTQDRNECKVCHGTGYLKSHSDAPDRPCPHCGYTMPEDGKND